MATKPAPVATFAPVPNPFSVAAAGPSVFGAPGAPRVDVFAPTAVDEAQAREPFRTKADSLEINMDGACAPVVTHAPVRGAYASAPTAAELLERAAALGPARVTWESIVLPSDPILSEKALPHVAERRARLTRAVKIGLSACVGLCVLALGVSALSGDPSPPSASAATSVGKTVASRAVVPIEALEAETHAKAARRRAAPARHKAAPRRHGAKRR